MYNSDGIFRRSFSTIRTYFNRNEKSEKFKEFETMPLLSLWNNNNNDDDEPPACLRKNK